MKYIYLDQVNSHIFSGGEVHVNISNYLPLEKDEYKIVATIKSSNDLMKLLLLNDAVRRELDSDYRIHLDMNYVPYARQDRVCSKGDAYSLSVFSKMINTCNFKTVSVLDPHSEAVELNIDRLEVYDNFAHVKHMLRKYKIKEFNLVAPDKGATNKINKLAYFLEELSDFRVNNIIQFDKKRDMQTGKIISYDIREQDKLKPDGMINVIVDDICDGGRTFMEAGVKLNYFGSKQNILFVTHGIFSKGTKDLIIYFNKIATTSSLGSDRNIKNVDILY